MGEIVNLRRARKRQAGARAEAEAAANRAAFGVSKSARNKTEIERALADKRHDGHLRRERDDAD